ncbi:hypothetical protein NE865_15231 [Phthorimaea operculella]|nr:hypothetical protein NE865_15231 [Phthorimaea operculella]
MEVDEGNRSRRDAPTPCGCSCGWFKTRLTQDQDLIVYQQPLRHVRDKPKTGDVGKNTVVSAIVVQNNGENDVSVQTEAFLTNSDVNEINCPRCKHHVQRARALLKDAFVLKDNNTCVCEMCDLQRLTHVPCLHCENVRKTLKLKDFFVSRKEDLIKQQEKNFLKSILGRRKTENQRRDFRAYSDIHLTDTIERICRHSQSVERPKSAVDSRYEHVLKPGFEPATGHDRSKKPWHRIRDKTDNLKNESLLGLGTTEIKPIEKDEVKQEGEKIKTGTETIEAKGIKGMIEEQKGTKKDRKQKQGKDKDEDKIKEKEDTAVADGEMEKIERDETASPTDKEKIQSEKDASRSKKSPKIDKSTEMHEVESEFVIPPESTAKLIKDLKKRRTSVEGVDEVTLLNEVLTKQENYIAVGKKVKKTKEDLLKYQKLKAKQTATKETEPDDSLQYLDPGANKKKKEKIAPKGGDHKKLKEDKMTVTEKPVAVPIEKIEVPIENIRVQAQDPGDDMLLKMIFKANQKKPAPRDLKKVKVKPIEPLPGLPIPQKRETPTETIATEKSDEDSQLGKEKASQLGKERARDSQLGKERARKSSLDIKPSKPKRELVLGTEIIRAKDAPPEPEPKSVPVFFHTEYNADDVNYTVPTPPTLDEDGKESTGGGPLLYALSDRKFIDNGWTVLPTEKIVNVYRMHPAYPEFDWFELNKKKGTMRYSTGEKLAEVDKNGRGRWYYKNGRLALNYYNCEEPNAQQRYVVYSSGEPDERGRSTPITVLGMFDFNGNGVVFDHGGKIRLKYNQNEGIVLDRSIGPVTQWKWHSLNDPPELQQVMIDSQLDYKDPTIFSYAADHYPPPQDETLLAIEYDNYIKSKEKKKEFKPNQINMKVMKLNDQFTLKVLDQNRIYLLFRDGATTMKCNLGLKIDHSDIVDTTFCDLGEVCVTAEKLPAATDSLADLQKCLKEAQKFNQVRVARELTKTPLLPTLSADRMTAAVSKPPRRPLLTENTGNRTPASGNMTYYNTRLI